MIWPTSPYDRAIAVRQETQGCNGKQLDPKMLGMGRGIPTPRLGRRYRCTSQPKGHISLLDAILQRMLPRYALRQGALAISDVHTHGL
jgi:hypothetical protein